MGKMPMVIGTTVTGRKLQIISGSRHHGITKMTGIGQLSCEEKKLLPKSAFLPMEKVMALFDLLYEKLSTWIACHLYSFRDKVTYKFLLSYFQPLSSGFLTN